MDMVESNEASALEAEAGEVCLDPKPLSSNGFVAFFQKIYRSWMGVWGGFKLKHKQLADLIYMVFFFVVFSLSVTVYQYIVILFLPYAFEALNNGPWGWAPMQIWDIDVTIIGDQAGLGSFIAYELAVFTGQCINFPLQRIITYHSHGNPWFQGFAYFVSWVIISLITGAIWGFLNVVCVHFGLADGVTSLLKTILTGGVSLVVMFFIFLWIFPDADKAEKSKKAAYDKAKAALDADPTNESKKAACDKAELAYTKAVEIREVYHAELTIKEKNNMAESMISAYQKSQKNLAKVQESTAKDVADGKMKQEDADAAIAAAEQAIVDAKDMATKAVIERTEIVPQQEEILARVKAQRAARAEAEKAAKAAKS